MTTITNKGHNITAGQNQNGLTITKNRQKSVVLITKSVNMTKCIIL